MTAERDDPARRDVERLLSHLAATTPSGTRLADDALRRAAVGQLEPAHLAVDDLAARGDDLRQADFARHFSEFCEVEIGRETLPGGLAISERPHDRVDAEK